MDAHTVMEEWEPSPFDGGFGGLTKLRSRGFSGAVETGATWLFLRDGEPLAVVSGLETEPRRGDIDAFEGATGTAHETSNPATASLAAMLALDGEIRGQYFTDDTPLSMVDETLSEGGFTGYVELSENVLSGDYYVVYEDGEAAHLGYVGSSNRLLTEDEAESKAENEVGIYSVVAVRFDDIEIPGPEPEPEPAPTAATTATEGSTVDSDPAGTAEAEADDGAASSAEPLVEDKTEDHEFDTTFDTAGNGAESTETASEDDSTSAPDETPESNVGSTSAIEEVDTGSEPADDESAELKPAVREVDEAESATAEADAAEPQSDDGVEPTESEPEPAPDDGDEPESVLDTADEPEPRANVESTTQDTETVPESRLEELREEYEERLEELREELSSLRTERDRLRERVRRLESAGDEPSGGRALSPAEALAETSLFVREGSRGEATLEDAHAGRADSEALRRNLRIEHHTQFDADGVTVDGEPFESWLKSSAAYEFVEWLVFELVFEIRAAGGESEMRHLYDALPNLDRIGFQETVTVGKEEGEGREIAFDVVARNRMGDPLAIATIDEGRDPTRAETVEPLVVDGSDICEAHESLVAAFAVTSSFFEPDALGTAREATSSSLLSREKYRGYVKLARKNGFHLCLVEAREGSYYLTMPEL